MTGALSRLFVFQETLTRLPKTVEQKTASPDKTGDFSPKDEFLVAGAPLSAGLLRRFSLRSVTSSPLSPLLLASIPVNANAWLEEHIASLATSADGRLDPQLRLALQVYLQERSALTGEVFGPKAGPYVAATLGSLGMGLIHGAELISEDVAKGRRIKLEETKQALLAHSREFEVLTEGVAVGKAMFCIDDRNFDWNSFEASMAEAFREDPDYLSMNLFILQSTGFLFPHAKEFWELIDSDGRVKPENRERFLDWLDESLERWLGLFDEQLEQQAELILGPGYRKKLLLGPEGEIAGIDDDGLSSTQRIEVETEWKPRLHQAKEMENFRKAFFKVRSGAEFEG